MAEVLRCQRPQCVGGVQPDELLADRRVGILEPIAAVLAVIAFVRLAVKQVNRQRHVAAHCLDEDDLALLVRQQIQVEIFFLRNCRD